MKRIFPISSNNFDKLNTFIELNSPLWRSYNHISLDELYNDLYAFIDKETTDFSKWIDNLSLIQDSSTLKIKINSSFLESPSVFGEQFIDQHINYYTPPKNASPVFGMHICTDGNYLYIWVGNRWKRAILSEW